jgi:hypothetical protein
MPIEIKTMKSENKQSEKTAKNENELKRLLNRNVNRKEINESLKK